MLSYYYRNYSNNSTPLEFRPLSFYQSHNYFFVLLNFDHANLNNKINFQPSFLSKTGRHVMHWRSHFVGCQRCGLASLTSKNDVKHVSMNRKIFQQSFIITNLPFYLIWHEIMDVSCDNKPSL